MELAVDDEEKLNAQRRKLRRKRKIKNARRGVLRTQNKGRKRNIATTAKFIANILNQRTRDPVNPCAIEAKMLMGCRYNPKDPDPDDDEGYFNF